jgi:hypothetical protein
MPTVSTKAQIDRFLARFTPEIRKLANDCRRALRRRMPTAVELVYDNYNALVFGFGPSERASEAILSIALYPRWINLFFLWGARLPDPDEILIGSGKQVRSIKLDAAARLDEPAVRALIDAEIVMNEVPLPAKGKGSTVIRAASAKQRSRRPAAAK